MSESKTIISIDDDIKKRAKIIALKKDTTLKEIVNQLLKQYVEENE